jgi:hypothetical protein
MAVALNQPTENEWVAFPGGELEGKRPKAMCGPCRLRRAAGAPPRAICFECHRADRRREEAIKAAGELEATPEGIDARFQNGLPFEPVNLPRLARLKAERADARQQARAGAGQYADKRRQAQIAARHALQRIALGLASRQIEPIERARAEAGAIHAAELQLPESWLPFVVSR